jgi:hypothetical protein
MAKKDTRFFNSRTNIKEVAQAALTYGVRHFRFPIDVVNHENALEDSGMIEEPHHRMTCRSCKRFQPPKHIIEHNERLSETLFPEDGSQ